MFIPETNTFFIYNVSAIGIGFQGTECVIYKDGRRYGWIL